MNVEAENEHFEISDLLISWMESHKSLSSTCEQNPSTSHKDLACDTNQLSEVLKRCFSSVSAAHQHLSAVGIGWNLVKIFIERQRPSISQDELRALEQSRVGGEKNVSPTQTQTSDLMDAAQFFEAELNGTGYESSPTEQDDSNIRMRGNDSWAPPREQIIFNIHEERNFRKLMQRQNYLCAGCGEEIDYELARRLVSYCHYLGKYFCKCCFSHKAINLPGYILQKWDFHKYQVSHFALQLLDRIANEPLFNVNDTNPSLYRKVKKLRHLVDIRMQLYYLRIYISTCTQMTDNLNVEYSSFTQQHLLQGDVHLYSLNNLIEIQHGKLYEYLNDLAARSIAHIAQCDRCRAKGHYCQLCGPSSLMSSMISTNTGVTPSSSDSSGIKDNQLQFKHTFSSTNEQSNSRSCETQPVGVASSASCSLPFSPVMKSSGSYIKTSSGNYSNLIMSANSHGSSSSGSIANSTTILVNTNDHELLFPFEIGRVAQCSACGCCSHIQCFIDAGQNCPKCERVQRRKAETTLLGASSSTNAITAT